MAIIASMSGVVGAVAGVVCAIPVVINLVRHRRRR
jgi:hypothetical protein